VPETRPASEFQLTFSPTLNVCFIDWDYMEGYRYHNKYPASVKVADWHLLLRQNFPYPNENGPKYNLLFPVTGKMAVV
jgi:hypothetical protein